MARCVSGGRPAGDIGVTQRVAVSFPRRGHLTCWMPHGTSAATDGESVRVTSRSEARLAFGDPADRKTMSP